MGVEWGAMLTLAVTLRRRGSKHLSLQLKGAGCLRWGETISHEVRLATSRALIQLLVLKVIESCRRVLLHIALCLVSIIGMCIAKLWQILV